MNKREKKRNTKYVHKKIKQTKERKRKIREKCEEKSGVVHVILIV